MAWHLGYMGVSFFEGTPLGGGVFAVLKGKPRKFTHFGCGLVASWKRRVL